MKQPNLNQVFEILTLLQKKGYNIQLQLKSFNCVPAYCLIHFDDNPAADIVNSIRFQENFIEIYEYLTTLKGTI
jgi:hypothetical protein